MPKYQIELEGGRRFMVEATGPPSQDDVYAALSQQQGAAPAASSLTDPNRQPARAEDFMPKPATAGSVFGNAIGGLWDTTVGGAVQGVAHMVNNQLQRGVQAYGDVKQGHYGDALKHAAGAVLPLDTLGEIAGAQLDQFSKAKQDYAQGHYSEMLGHAGAGLLPVLGPAAAHAGEVMGQGGANNIARGLGEGAGLIASLGLGKSAPAAAERAFTGTGETLVGAGKRIINSNLKVPERLKQQNPGKDFADIYYKGGLSTNPSKMMEQATNTTKGLATTKAGMLDTAFAAGRRFDPQVMETELLTLRKRLEIQPLAERDLAAVDDALAELRRSPVFTRPHYQLINGQPVQVGRRFRTVDPRVAEKAKQTVQGGLSGKYGKEGATVIEADKALGRGLRLGLEQVDNELGPVNEAMSDSIVMRNAARKMKGRIENNYPFGLMEVVGAGALAAAHPALAAIPFAVSTVLKHPSTGLRIGKALYRAGERVAGQAPNAARAATAAVVGGRVNNALMKSEVDRAYQAWADSLAQQ